MHNDHDAKRRAIDALAAAWVDHRQAHPDALFGPWLEEVARMVEARAASLGRVEIHGAMGGGGADEA